MPNTEEPEIEAWVSELFKICPNPDKNTYFIGHSIGCQTILRYLERLPKWSSVGDVILVAPWTKLKPIIKKEERAEKIAEPWIKTPIKWDYVKSKANKFTAIFSTNDYYVYSDEKKLFKQSLNADTMLIKNKGHFTDEDKVTKLPELLKLL